MLCPRTALQGHEPSFTGDLGCCHLCSPLCAHTCLASMYPGTGTRPMARSVPGVPGRDISEDTPADHARSLQGSLQAPLLQLHYFCSCKSASYKQKHLFIPPALSIVFVASTTTSFFTYNQPETHPPKHTSPRNTHRGSMPVPWLRAVFEFLQRHAHSSGTKVGAACEKTTLQLRFTQVHITLTPGQGTSYLCFTYGCISPRFQLEIQKGEHSSLSFVPQSRDNCLLSSPVTSRVGCKPYLASFSNNIFSLI